MSKETLLIWISCLLLATSCGRSSQAQQKTPSGQIVHTATVRDSVVVQPIRTSGLVMQKEQINLSFKIGGIIDRVFVDEGETVTQGQPLAALDLTEIDAQVDQTRVGLEKAERDLARAQNLYADSVATKAQVQDAASARDNAAAALDIARYNRQHATIKAPTDGRVLRQMAEESELIAPGQPILVVANTTSATILRVGLIDRDVVRVSLGDSATVRFDAYPDMDFAATVSEIGDAADQTSGTFELELTIQTGGRKLPTGFVGRATIFPQKGVRYHLIPVQSMIEADGKQGFVFTISDDQRAQKTAVEIGMILDQTLGIVRGLEDAEAVITDGAAYVRDGEMVQVE